MKSYEDPVIVRNITPVSGRIQWARHLAQRLEQPMEIFKQHPSVFEGAAGRRIIHMYNRVSQVLLEYEMVYHKAWLDTIDVVDGGTSDDRGQFSLSCRAVQWKCGNPSILKSTLYKIAATLRGSRPRVQSASLIMTSLMTS